MKRKGILVLITLLLIVFSTQKSIAQYGPGGVGDMTNTQLWLKSDSLIAILPTYYVTGWFDQSGQGHDFQALTMGQAVPSLTMNSINGFPAVTFDESAKQYLGYNGTLNITGSDATTVAIVARNNSTVDEANGGLYIGRKNVGGANAVRDYGLEYNDAVRFNGENQIFNDGHGQGEWNLIVYSNPAGSTVANYKAWLNGTALTGSSGSATVPALPAANLFALLGATQMNGVYNPTGYFNGDMTEVAVFSSALTDAERIVLENNLGARYHLNISDDYYAYQDTYYWDVSGIAENNGTTFTNAWSSDILSINSPTDLSNNEYLFFGNDHKQITTWTNTEVPANGTYRLSREWAVDETGDVGTVTLSIPSAMLPAFPSGYFRVGILTDATSDFTTGATLHEAFLNGGTGNYEVSLNLTAGTHLAIVCFRPEIEFAATTASGLESVSPVTMTFVLNYPFTVTQSADYSVTGGTATNGTDYNLAAGTVAFAPGEVSKTVNFTVVDDQILEPNETVIVSLSNPSSEVTLGANNPYTYTIIDNDVLYASFSSATASENEGNAAHSVGVPTITLSGAILQSPASVTLTVTNGTAQSGDWSQTDGVITIPPGNYVAATQLSIPAAALSILGDNTVEPDETINLNLNTFVTATAGATTNCTYTIVNDDNATVSVVATTASVTEGGPGPVGTGTFTFSLTNPCSTARTVTYSVSGTATSGTDFVALPGTITIPANTTSVTATLTTIADLIAEGDETVSLKITAISGAPAVTIDPTSAVMTIIDDDIPSIQYSPASISMPEGGTATFDVWLGAAPQTPVVLNISTVKAGVLTLNKVTLTFTTANYATHQTVTVTAVDDNMMGNLTDDIIISVNDASSDDHFDPLPNADIPVTVINNDIASLVITPTAVTVAENATATFTVALSAGPSTGNVVVNLTSNDLTVATIDKPTLTFTSANWSTPQTVTVTGVNNNIIPNTSTTISLAVNNALSDDDYDGKTGTVTVNVTNDDIAGFTVSPLTLNLNEGGPAGSFTIVLNAQPQSNVVFDLVNASPVYVTTVAQVTFTPANWNVPQTITVTPIEDALDLERTDFVVVTVNKPLTDDNFDSMPSQTVTINITDNDPPIITGCPSNITTGNTLGSCSAVVSWTAPTSTSPMVSDHNPGETFPVGTTTVTYTSTDPEGMVTKCIFTVTVNDTEAPKITCPANLSGISPDAGKCYANGVALGTPVTSDNCGVASVTNNAPAQFPAGTTSVVWTVTDSKGLTATCTQTVTVVDNIAPTITCPTNVTVNVDAGSCSATGVVLGTPTYADNCTGATVTNNAPASFPRGTTNVTWTVTDGAGLTATCVQTVTVVDNIPPTITCPAAVNRTADAGKCYATSVPLGLPTASDNCSVASVTNNAPAQFPIGTTTVTWTATDVAGLTATCTQTVTVTDGQPPVITCPANKSGISPDAGKCYATGVSLGMPVTSDNCAVASVTNNAPAQFPVGTTTVVWTVTDASGLTATCNQTVTVVDNIAPSITCPPNLSGISPDAGKCYATGVALGTPVTSDNCTVASVTNNAPAQFPVGTTTVVWTVKDAAGLTATCSQTVTVVDNIAPTITCPANLANVPMDAGKCYASGVSLGTPVYSDNCTGSTVTNNAPAQFPIGTTTVTWTVKDAAGNTSTCNQTVTVVDNQLPSIICPPNKTLISANPGLCYATGISLGTPTTSDNCGVASVTNNAPVQYPVGTTTVTWTVTDANGNTKSCNQSVTVVDTEAPHIICPSSLTDVPADAGSCSASGLDLGTPVTSDNCGIQSVTNNAPSSFPMGTTLVIWTAKDIHNNTATCMQTVEVVDLTPPTITCPANLTGILADAGKCYATGVSLGTPVTSDNCGVANVTNDAPAQFPLGTTTVTWTATDNSGLTATCTQTVQVVDGQAPVITCPANLTSVPADAGVCYATGVSLGTPVASDNCGVPVVTNNAPAQFPLGSTTVTWTATDAGGLFATCTQTVTVVDTQLPLITCPANITGLVPDAGKCYATGVVLGTPVTSDNCGVATVTNNAPAQFPTGTTTVTWTVTDVNGLISTCNQTVQVSDNQPPTITCPPDLTAVPADAGKCYATSVALGTPVATDNCGAPAITNNAPAQFPVGTTLVTWTATDSNGLTATCSQSVTVVDLQLPVITCPANLTGVPNDPGLCYATGVSLGTPVTSDNCGVATVVNDAPAQYPIGTTTVKWTVTDVNGLVATCNQTVTVTDTELPLISCPANITGLAPDAGSCFATGVVLGTLAATDNCGIASITNNAPAQFPIGTTTVTWTVTDNSGLKSTCTQTVQVVDSEAPAITCPADITGAVPDAGKCFATGIALGTPVTTDNCGVATVTNNAPAQYPIGTTVVTWTVTDNSGLSATCNQNVTVVDSELPTITCPASIMDYMADINQCYASGVSLGLPTASDNCGVASITNDAPAQFPVGTTIITWKVTDVNGSTNTCAQTVEIIDTQSPQIICPGNMTINSTPGICGAIAPWAVPFATDNCPGLVVTSNFNPGDVLPLGVTTVKYLATDASGNTATCSFKATVKDVEPPTIVPHNGTFYLNAAGSVSIIYNDVTDTVYDHCALASVTLSKSVFNCSNLGPNNVTITAKDNAGNTSTAVAVVTIADTISPVLACKPATAYIGATGNVTITPADVTGSAIDNCSVAGTVIDKNSFTCADLGNVNVVLTATDNSGNTSTCTAVVTVVDTLTVKVSAGPDIAVCTGDATVTVNSSWVYNGSVLWTTSGDGTFNNATDIHPIYTFGPADAAGVKLTATATKINGCTSTASDDVQVTYISNPTITAGTDKQLCSSDASYKVTEATTTGGTVTWSTSGDGTFDNVNSVNPVYTFGPTDHSGSVTLTMTVSAGTCPPVTDDMVITFVPSSLANAGAGGSICASTAGFQITGASHSGGTVTWSTSGNGTFDDATKDNPFYTLGSSDKKAASVTLTMTVTGTGTCGNVTSSSTLTILPIPGINITAHSDISCNGYNDGIISVVGVNGSPSYSYSIDGSPYFAAGDFGSLTPGPHIISVMDAGGCPADTTVTITEPAGFTFKLDTVINMACYGLSTGAINITVSGGTAPYQFQWTGPNSFTSANEDIAGLVAGSYSLTLTDANLCNTFTLDTVIKEGNQIIVDIDTISNYAGFGTKCYGSADGFIKTTVSGGAGTLALQWTGPDSFLSTTDDISGLAAGSYIFTVTDTSNCVVATTVNITQPDEIGITPTITKASCPGAKDGGITITTNGGTAPLAFLWSDGSTQQNRTGIEGGEYTVLVTDANGCTSQLKDTVEYTGYNCIIIPTIITPNGDGVNDTWIIGNAEMYPDIEVLVYTRWGKLVYSSRNPNENPWDGKFKGVLLPNDSYHYIIRLHDGTSPRTGVISIISK
jgi:gliding motility-associated-like protein